MKKIRTFWFNTLDGCFGIVVGEDDVTGKKKAYCGVVPGNDEEADETRIMRTGSVLDPRLLREALNLLEPTHDSRYAEWALKVIVLIADDDRVDLGVRLEEIKVATRPADSFREPFNDGDSPEDAWEGEVGAIADSA